MAAQPASAVDAAVEQLVVARTVLKHTAESVLLSVMATVDETELDQCRHALITAVPGPHWHRLLDLSPAAARYFNAPRMSPQRAIAFQRVQLRSAALHEQT